MEPGKPWEVLVVSGEIERARELAGHLSQQLAAVRWELRGDVAYAGLARNIPDLVLIDADAAGLPGRDFCRAARDAGHALPIVVMARSDDPMEHVLCLELGADDFIAGPVPWRLLWARLKAILRRATGGQGADADGQTLRIGAFALDRRALELRLHGSTVALTPTEFGCLWLLATRAGRVVSRAELWHVSANSGSVRAVDSQICRLRRKLDRADPAASPIRSVRLLGYLFSPALR